MTYNLLSFITVIKSVGYVLAAVLILLAMVTIHEFGHYLVGKLLKFNVEEFSIGFGPAIYKRKSQKTGEQFSLRLIPLGGYCAFEGEDETGESTSPYAFNNRAPWRRILVLIAGAAMNYLLALIIIIGVFFSYGQLLLVTYQVEPTVEYSAEYCFCDLDVILEADGKNVYMTTDIAEVLSGKQRGEKVEFVVSRVVDAENNTREVVTVEIALRSDVGDISVSELDPVWQALGIAKVPNSSGEEVWQIYSTTCKFGFFKTIGRSVAYSGRIAGSVFTVLGELLTGKLSITAMGGPITTIKVTSQMAAAGLHTYLEIAAYIGVNLAVFNLLPIPALDGSKIVFTAIEWIRKKPINRNVEAIIHAVGFVAIFAFAILVDVLQLL